MSNQCSDCMSKLWQTRIVDTAPFEAPVTRLVRETRCLGCGNLREREAL